MASLRSRCFSDSPDASESPTIPAAIAPGRALYLRSHGIGLAKLCASIWLFWIDALEPVNRSWLPNGVVIGNADAARILCGFDYFQPAYPRHAGTDVGSSRRIPAGRHRVRNRVDCPAASFRTI